MYKDRDKQREANRKAMKRYREAEQRRKGITENDVSDTHPVIPCDTVIPKGVTDAERDEAIEFMAKTAGEVERFEKFVGIPCDILNADKPKRGKDIKPQSHSPMMVGYVPPREV